MLLLFTGTKVDIFFICKTVESIFYAESSKKISYLYKSIANRDNYVTK